ncbi:acyl-CoA dehydrogenase family protein [Rhodococcus sp. DMU1]|uniref:acyl-CoA dehydrogenase family protein n=1 Tax=Rhodococcus sp. DMU1 TaxID=2722825 RepID=UPI00143EDA4F|nr:acyl-CoA dehydrogenase family protein [Rhodococcus sp. DMU1]QIX53867.1 acyl-CoA dehydrogenase [Rhodococcus sp. DMU1]
MSVLDPVLAEFRGDVRAWFADNAPSPKEDPRAPGIDSAEHLDRQRSWLTILNRRGFGAPHVPVEWGGGGLDMAHQIVLFEEWARADAPTLDAFLISLRHLPETLLEAGTVEQRERFIRQAISGTVWCQGFSEPGAGSDLSSLRTKAVPDGDGWVVTGQKIWSSNAVFADHCLLLARTDPDSVRGEGIGYFIMDMKAPGVDVRPIGQITGHSEFCEIFIDEVRIPGDCVIGDPSDGWRIAQTTLQAERGPFGVELIERVVFNLEQALSSTCSHEEARSRELTRMLARAYAVRALALETYSSMMDDETSGGAASTLKVAYTELLQDATSLLMLQRGTTALIDPSVEHFQGWVSGHSSIDWLGSWGLTISGGSNEIQRTIIAQRVLGLPRGVRR